MNLFQDGGVVWLMGLAGSGKSTLARKIYTELIGQYQNIIYLDGDELRDIFEHYGYDKDSRIDMAIKRANLAQFLAKQKMLVIISTISLFKEVYLYNRTHIKNYYEIYVKCDRKELKKRNQKGLYSGEIKDVVGMDIPYDEPEPNLILSNNMPSDIDKNMAIILQNLQNLGR